MPENKYLVKIAGWIEIENGVYHDPDTGKFEITTDAKKRIDKKMDTRHILKGVKTFSGIGGVSGAALGAAFGPKSVFKGKPGFKASLARAAIGAGVGGLVGSGVGATLASGGNSQAHSNTGHESVRRSDYLNELVGNYKGTSKYHLTRK